MADLLADPTTLPSFAAATPDAIGLALDQALREHEATVAAIVAGGPAGFSDVWLSFEHANTRLDALWATVSHLHGVADTPALRAAHNAGERRIVDNGVAVGQNRELYDCLVALTEGSEFATLDIADRVAVERALRDFRLSGVSLDESARERFRSISVELAELSSAFGAAVLDATDAWSCHVVDETQLDGLPFADKAMLAEAARNKGLGGWLVTLQAPCVAAVMMFAENRELRASLYHAFGTRASDQGPNAGEFDNGPRIRRILELRREVASLLGFANFVEASLATKMAPNADGVLLYLRDLAGRARPVAEQELRELRAFAASTLGIEELEPWDMGFAAYRLREARHVIDEQRVRSYFPIARVLDGWRALLARLFGIRLVARPEVETWHPLAAYYDVVDESGVVIAGVYLDLHARAAKRSGAWMAPARPRLTWGDRAMPPVAYLVCNFAPGSETIPPLLSHGDVVTLLHETGHVLHHLFTRVDRPSIAGTSGFEWDAVEFPSQLMEDFAWDRDVITAMSGHYETGEPLPGDLYNAMLSARHFQSGSAILRQVEFALFDLLLHLDKSASDPMKVLTSVRDEVAVVRAPDWHRSPHSFSHIFSGGYAAGYYSYLWAELLAADGFQAFAEAGVVDRATGDRLRGEVLACGASRPAAESFRAFRGRDADPAALLVRHGLA